MSRVDLFLLRYRRGRGNDLGTTIKYLRKQRTVPRATAGNHDQAPAKTKKNGAAGICLNTMIHYSRRTANVAVGNGLGYTLNCLRRAAGNGRAQ
jgi:hypothetical protein